MPDANPIRVKDKIQLRTNITNIATIAAMTRVVREHEPILPRDVKPYFMAEKEKVSKKKKATIQDTQTEPTLALYGLIEYLADGRTRVSDLGKHLVDLFARPNVTDNERAALLVELIMAWKDTNLGRNIHPGIILLKLLTDKELAYEISDHEFTEFLWDSRYKFDSDYAGIRSAILDFRAKGNNAVSYEVKRSKTYLFLPALVTTWKLLDKTKIFDLQSTANGAFEWIPAGGSLESEDEDSGSDVDVDKDGEDETSGTSSTLPYSKVTFYALKPAVRIIVKWRFEMDKYLAAIRTKPFVLLAGISGTGKSRLVRQLARGCCPEKDGAGNVHALYDKKKPGNFESIPVKPNWHDSTELLGYVTRITEDKKPKFVLTPFVKFLAKAWMNEDVPFFLCLDEMNLAPVEQYFAEYLSVIESRKKNDAGKIETDVMVRFDVAQSSSAAGTPATTENFVKETVAALLEKELASADAAVKAKATLLQTTWEKDGGIRIPENLVVMGTVNMDETTCTFSRKVLDRAMSFELNVDDAMYAAANLPEEGDATYGSIDKTKAKCELLTGNDAYLALGASDGDKVLEYIKTLNVAMKDTQFKIAYRSRNEILVYCRERTKSGVVGLRQALDEATSMKILSRIEGDDQKFSKFKLGEFLKIVVKALLKIDNASVSDADVTAFLADEEKVKASPSAYKLKRMRDDLDSGAGFVSFWEC